MGFLEDCDNVVLASPVWFSALSGVTMNIASRLQTYFAGRYFRGETTPLRHKNSALFFAGAEPGTEERAAFSARVILKHLNALPVAAAVLSMNTNEIPAAEDKTALAQARQTAELLRALTMTA
jgi:multimeric flavodoxin WrbA